MRAMRLVKDMQRVQNLIVLNKQNRYKIPLMNLNRKDQFKIILACLSGNVLEWFDFAVYGYLAPVLATEFFPSAHKLTGILLSYSVFAIGFLARPLGALIFGHIGDTRGRKTALLLSTVAMAIPTCLIGILPVYASVGLLAPLLLILCRICQGLSVGGEFTGSFIYLIEQASHKRRGFFSCWADVGCAIGMILGSATVALLNAVYTHDQLQHFGWRLPFLSGILLALVAFYMRSHLFESAEFLQIKKTRATPLRDAFKEYPAVIFYSTLLIAINSLAFYILVVFLPNQNVLLGKFSAEKIYLFNIIILFVVMLSTILAASACDYFDKVKIYIIGATGCLLLAYPVFYALNHFGLSGQLLLLGLFSIAVGCCYGPRPLLLVESAQTRIRYSTIAFSFNIGNALFGGTAPLLATFLVAKTGSIELPSILVIIAAALTLVAIIQLKRL